MAHEQKTQPTDAGVLASGHSGEMGRVGFSPRKANLVLYGLQSYGTNADLIDRLGKHKLGKGCVYVTKLADVDEAVLRQLIRRGWFDSAADFEATHPGSDVAARDDG